ncbi:ROK family glucokinase [Virgibacillus alimentarius]|uniref:Glucokinase n=1 Tax=Virgibacillus alimentarius TaxID=698769 RepID=A0ABS4SAH7_9BACI|nr:ROK family glucokinase [Virgibacillus alimentarius]MBP2258106.1 glucokinase [Virgibacillus alimentarius]
MEEVIIGLDIGGTSIKIGFLQRDGNIIHKWEIPTNKSNNGIYIVDEIWQSITEQLVSLEMDKKEIVKIGTGAPGFIEKETGMVYETTNMGWKNFELAKRLKELANVPVYVENDANMAALGENWKGSGNQAKDLIFVTLGTGVGSGIIANGKILNGRNGTAGEIGHLTVEPGGYLCNCGRKGCLETIASATGVVRQAMDKMEEHPKSSLAAYYKENGIITSKEIFKFASQGDTICGEIVTRTTDMLGVALADVSVIINPSKIIIGGGMSKAGDALLEPVAHAFHKHALGRISEVCEITIATLGNDAGIIGACTL